MLAIEADLMFFNAAVFVHVRKTVTCSLLIFFGARSSVSLPISNSGLGPEITVDRPLT